MCLIVDSNNSLAFKAIPRLFGQPLLVLMSPEEIPQPFHEQHKGSLFTLFLHCPLTALCLISNIIEMPVQVKFKLIFKLILNNQNTIFVCLFVLDMGESTS